MQTVQGNTLQSLRGVRDFLDVNATRLGTIVSSGARQRLQRAIDELEGDAHIQDGSARESRAATLQQRDLRAMLLRDHMTPIARIASADLPHTVQLDALRMPRTKQSTEKLAAAAHGMGSTAAPYSATFIAAGLPEDFIGRLDAAADAMIASNQARMQVRTIRCVATTGLRTRLAEGRSVVRVLNAFVQTALKDDPALLSGWDMVRRRRRTAVSSAPASPPVPLASRDLSS